MTTFNVWIGVFLYRKGGKSKGIFDRVWKGMSRQGMWISCVEVMAMVGLIMMRHAGSFTHFFLFLFLYIQKTQLARLLPLKLLLYQWKANPLTHLPLFSFLPFFILFRLLSDPILFLKPQLFSNFPSYFYRRTQYMLVNFYLIV